MKKFYNRSAEIAALRDIQAESHYQARFTYILGQRRVGKTRLIEHVFLKQAQISKTPESLKSSQLSKKNRKKRVLYFFVERKSVETLLKEFSEVTKEVFELTPEFKDVSSFFKYLFEQAMQGQLTVIFDEFQNFNYVDKSIFSSLQKLWDKYKRDSLLNLIVIGSIYSSMEKIFANQHEPLWGRPTDKLTVKTFDIQTLWEILKDHQAASFENLLNYYTLFNGIPKYWDILEYRNLFGKSPSTVLSDLFLSPRSLLLNEGKELLMEEFGPDYQTYFSIIEAVATLRKVSTHKISARTGIASQHVHTYLAALNKKFNLIATKTSLINPTNKKNRYVLHNRFLQTWFRYIFANKSLVESGNIQAVLDKFNRDFSSYKGVAFEELTQKFLEMNFANFPYEEWSQYWDKNREIDLLGINKSKKIAMVGECKLSWRGFIDKKETVMAKIEADAAYIASLLPGYTVKKYLFVGENMVGNVNMAENMVGNSRAADGFLTEVNDHSSQVNIVTARDLLGLMETAASAHSLASATSL